jgi:ferredoxin-NADP reductase
VTVAGEFLDWRLATVVAVREETPSVKTIACRLPEWRGHRAGQHVDVRLTAEDGYQAERSYSIASAAAEEPAQMEITVERIANGEVSSFLTGELRVGDTFEIRGPIGGYFTWLPNTQAPLMLIAGGSGVVPLMSMLRTRDRSANRGPAALLYSARKRDALIYQAELDRLAAKGDGLTVTYTLTRECPADWQGETGRVDEGMLKTHAIRADRRPVAFVCGPTLFVEAVAEQLLRLGYSEAAIKTERFGPTGQNS